MPKQIGALEFGSEITSDYQLAALAASKQSFFVLDHKPTTQEYAELARQKDLAFFVVRNKKLLDRLGANERLIRYRADNTSVHSVPGRRPGQRPPRRAEANSKIPYQSFQRELLKGAFAKGEHRGPERILSEG
jgi:hypothetical protein